MLMASMERCRKNPDDAAYIVAINIVLQNNSYSLLDLFEHYKDKETISAIQTIYTASNITCAYLMHENDLTMEDVSNALFDLAKDMSNRMGSKEARRFSATIESSFIEFKKAMEYYFKDAEKGLQYFRKMDLKMIKKDVEHI